MYNAISNELYDLTAARRETSTRRLSALNADRLLAAKRSYATRHIDLGDGATLIAGAVRPKTGDLVLARIERRGHHKRIENTAGRRAHFYVGDEVLLVYGNRYATDQFEAVVPEHLGPCHMVAAGGIAAACRERNASAQPPTVIEPLGLVGDAQGRPLNLANYAQQWPSPATGEATVTAVVGTSMNSGKTTMAATLIHGLVKAGCRVVSGKVTGTGSGGDLWQAIDAGAHIAVDFTDFGLPSTYLAPPERLARLFGEMCDGLNQDGVDHVVLEIADGLFFPETADLVRSAAFRQRVDGILLAAGDSMGAVAGVARLRENALPLLAVGGKVTSSPLMVREAAAAVDIPIVTLGALKSGAWVPHAAFQPRAATA